MARVRWAPASLLRTARPSISSWPSSDGRCQGDGTLYEDDQAQEDGRQCHVRLVRPKDEQRFPLQAQARKVRGRWQIVQRNQWAGEHVGLRGRLHLVSYLNDLVSGGKHDRPAALRAFPICSFPLSCINDQCGPRARHFWQAGSGVTTPWSSASPPTTSVAILTEERPAKTRTARCGTQCHCPQYCGRLRRAGG